MSAVAKLAQRAGALCAVTAIAGVSSGAGVAQALTPPVVDTGAVPADVVGPEQGMRLNVICQTPGVLPDSAFGDPPAPWRLMNLDAVRPFATGAGVTVAIIDTGAAPNPRLPNLRPGGDFVTENGDGLDDCDGHGTLVAGIIGAAPHPGDAFVGVAPDAAVISIRQSSQHYTLEHPDPGRRDDPNASQTAMDLRAMARAIVHAVNLGASVINISMVSCMKAVRHVDDRELGAALHWAVAERNAVVVAAAGNTGGDCRQNPPPPGGAPGSWDNVVTIATPAWWADDVLAVGSVNDTGVPSSFTMQGPWVDVAAPGENIASVGNYPDGHLVNGLPGQDQILVPIYGNSFSAAYVSGVVALIRQKYPDLNPYQVMNRVKATAHAGPTTPDPSIGWGVVDPLAALTWNVPDPPPSFPVNKIIHPAPPPPAPDYTPRTVATYTLVGFLAAGALGIVARAVLRRKAQS